MNRTIIILHESLYARHYDLPNLQFPFFDFRFSIYDQSKSLHNIKHRMRSHLSLHTITYLPSVPTSRLYTHIQIQRFDLNFETWTLNFRFFMIIIQFLFFHDFCDSIKFGTILYSILRSTLYVLRCHLCRFVYIV